jgi:hypothetical protein
MKRCRINSTDKEAVRSKEPSSAQSTSLRGRGRPRDRDACHLGDPQMRVAGSRDASSELGYGKRDPANPTRTPPFPPWSG